MGHVEDSFRGQRERAVERLVRARYLRSPAVIRAMKTVPREAFLPEGLRAQAYIDTPLPIGWGQTISAMHMVAMMAEALRLEQGQRILEVGCGSGYHAAVVAEIVAHRETRRGHVYSLEIVPELHRVAAANLRRTRYDAWVTAIHGDGSLGYGAHAPFDRVLVTASAPSIPGPLIEQLRDGGFLVIPVGNLHFFQELLRIRKEGERIHEERLGGVAFVPLRGKHGWTI